MKTLSERTIENERMFRKKERRLEKHRAYQGYKERELILNATPEDSNIFERLGYALRRAIIHITPARHYYDKAEH